MRFISRSALLAFVAVCVIGVVGAASASAALPEFSPAGSVAKPVKFKGKSSLLEIKSANIRSRTLGRNHRLERSSQRIRQVAQRARFSLQE